MTDLDVNAWYAARSAMVDALVADLYGATDADDILTEAPLSRFVVGILHPRSDEPIEDVRDDDQSDTSTATDSGNDPAVALARMRYPSTMGLTFSVAADTLSVEVEVSADQYRQVVDPLEEAEVREELVQRAEERRARLGDGAAAVDVEDEEPEEAETRAATRNEGLWRVVPQDPRTFSVDVTRPGTYQKWDVANDLVLRTVIRPERDDAVSVTVVLVNTHARPEKGFADALCWFRPRLAVTTPDGHFVDRRPVRELAFQDEDERSGELLYRTERHLAVGHGCAVTWEEGSLVQRVETTFFPSHELRLARADRNDVPRLSMKALGADDDRGALVGLVDVYEQWIAGQESRVPVLDARHVPTAKRHLADARRAVARMREGIALLDRDPQAAQAFRIMNEVMQQQRIRQVMVRGGLETPPDIEGQWRPFQMAFVLLNLVGLADPKHPDRDVADLLWFPTGGGKTEAYLGLIAFVLALRRFRGGHEAGAGVGVVMRYTLRLLTIQQFERAAGLICALEEWRRREAPDVPVFSIGLWVGQGATPNDVKAAAKALKKIQDGEEPSDAGNPRQLLRCPWCGTALPADAYHADVREDRMTVRCPGETCDFHDGLPVHLVDTDVYAHRPSLVIGTVDKFAMLAWRDDAGVVLGAFHDAKPDLIIQDELHLISGPLGTLVGLYETAVDALATSDDGVRPKLVASTATIRRATDQVEAVFDRSAQQFPPPGLDAGDSFFAVDADPQDRPTRRYVGVMAPSTSHATLLVRVYAALLQAGSDLDAPDEVRDAYWTMLGYFNSLRVLGAAYIQSLDDVPDRMKVVAARAGHQVREIRDPREMTSRKRSSEIPEELARLSASYPDPESPDVVLATNMISVGVDVDRLGLMSVMGQPQMTSEYIQATSRVGRSHPGLVVTMFNAAKSRDLSHYESFTTYHRALYKQVEATGATPFAPRALDRALHGLLVILARHSVAGASGSASVGVPVESEAFEDLVEVIAARACAVKPETEDEVRDALETLVESWSDAVKDGQVQKYEGWVSAEGALMVPAGGSPYGHSDGGSAADIFPVDEPHWPTLTSLRNVDRESTLRIVTRKRVK
ncbi:helicase-related protein [Myceligenerans pegani]|uniref:Helicase n=1 Tax=Myceligenerans pegani TaxID=2776917 RepID=A0ABR9N1M9_9MICO|nr:helicase-related protein [Myceligenerans sp. TRM 65318]MBE1877565.1 helicase [Myceligenerans sp. TRM 65318]MBE3019836.1 helicase [Myceligenerans sp. TRM 65318]